MNRQEIVAELLSSRRLTLATAESLTGGQVGQLVTSVAGASQFYRGGIIAYATEVKERVLGVDGDLLARHGPVSHQAATAMAGAARDMFTAAIGLSTTGVAGPTEQDGHPVGTLFIGICSSGNTRSVALRGPAADRNEMRAWAAGEALRVLIEELNAGPSTSADTGPSPGLR